MSLNYWIHGGLAALIVGFWGWARRHVKYFKARINGYVIEKKDGHR